ncbi:MAG: iron ABC transporter permease [Nitrospirota bacterium]
MAAATIICVVFAPLLVVFSSWLTPADDIFQHLLQTELWGVLMNTFRLLLGVAFGTTVLGVTLAWLTAAFEFPGRAIFHWALVLPLAIPAYVLAFVNIALFDVTGVVQNFMRAQFVFSSFPGIRGTGGIIWVMTLAFYPYVYLLARNGFLTSGNRAMEAARSMGYRPVRAFFKVALPMAKPMIISGLLLALMETLSDFGAVSIFNYDTLTTTLYKAWFSMFSVNAATKISFILVVFSFILLLLEQRGIKGRFAFSSQKQTAPIVRKKLVGVSSYLASFYCFLILFFAFIIPVIYLLSGALTVFHDDFNARYFGFLNRSILLAALAALLTVLSALILVYTGRYSRRASTAFFMKLATLGYALPGAIFAVGGIVLVTSFDHQLKEWGIHSDFFITGTFVAMMMGYVARFMALAHNPLDSAMRKITPYLDEAAQSLGAGRLRIIWKVHTPLLRGGLAVSAIFVFVDMMKEMPITLMTRPFGWDTLAVRIFEFTSEGEWERAALPALTLVIVGLIPVILLTKQSFRSDH